MTTASITVARPLPATRLLGTWLAMAVAMSANGVLRELLLVRALPERAAGIASALLGAVIILTITRVGLRPLRDATTSTLLGVSAALLVATVAFELAIGRWVDGMSWAELGRTYAFWRGAPWPFVLAVLGVTPFVWGRWARDVRRAES